MSDTQLQEVSDSEKQMAMFAYISSIVGLFPPLIIMLVKGDSAFVKYHAIQAIILSVAAGMFVVITFGFGFFLLPIYWIICVVWGMKANKGSWDGYPAIGGIGRPT